MNAEHFFLTGEAVCEPYLYRGCGLEGIYLLNGYTIFEHDDEPHVSIKNLEGLHQAIGRHLAINRKGLAPKEIKFLRNTLGLTQAELASKLGNDSQSVARWEKGQTDIPGSAEKLLRLIFLASLVRDDELELLKELLETKLDELDQRDQLSSRAAQFELFDEWAERSAA